MTSPSGDTGRGLPDETVRALAAELAAAQRSRTTVPRITARHPAATVEDAYAIQRIWREQARSSGRHLVGRKIGLTSRAMQQATGIGEPDYGVMFADTVFETGAVLEHAVYTNVRVEVELAFVLDAPLAGPGVSITEVLAATRFVQPALEVLDAHVELEGRTIVDTIADNAAYGAMVLGGSPVAADAVDIRRVGALLYRNGAIEETGVAAGVLDHPARGVAWLANKLARHGDALGAGEIVLAGSFTRPTWVSPGDTVHADFFELGNVTCHFT